MKLRNLAAGALLLFTTLSCRAQILNPGSTPSIEPKTDAVFTPSREVRALRFVGQDLWAATAGGVLRFNGKWTKWTRQNGLPSNEAFDLEAGTGGIIARFPLQKVTFDGQAWVSTPAPAFQKGDVTAIWDGKPVVANLDGITVGGKPIADPPSIGTHVSALAVSGKTLIAAMYGDGLWRYDGKKWAPHELNGNLVAPIREITALASNGSNLYIGTRRAGVWKVAEGKWEPLGAIWGAEIFDANVQVLGAALGCVWASTLDDGLMVRDGAQWAQITVPTISSTAPRQVMEWNGRLYLRNGSGVVDSFDGRNWTKNALRAMPRQGVYALDGDKTTLFAAGWGGWSEFDGSRWTPHFEVPELKGVPLMGIMADGDKLWLATQSRGLGCYDRATKTFQWYDERADMPDDWITALAKFDGTVYAGTFVGGLARLEGKKWVCFEELKGENVTALVASGKSLYVATRKGVWVLTAGKLTRLNQAWLDSEDQALCLGKSGLWVGARTSLNFVKFGTAA